MTVVESLSEYTRRIIREKELNYRKVADAAKAAGYEISHSTVGNIVNKSTEDVGVETLRALAHGLGVPEDELINIAAKNSTSSARRQAGFEKSEWALMFYQYNDLSERDKTELNGVLSMLDSEIKRRRLTPKGKGKTAAGNKTRRP